MALLLVLMSMEMSEQGLLEEIRHSMSRTNPAAGISRPVGIGVVERELPVVAVSSDGRGIVGRLRLKTMPGNNNVFIDTNPFSETDIQYSLNKAVAVAKQMSNYTYDRDFIFSFDMPETGLVGGESAGAAATILAIAAIDGLELRNDTVITGTIGLDGSIGRIGGVIEKAKAVADAGFRRFLLPKGQATITYYERMTERKDYGYYEILKTRYVPRTFDLSKAAGKEWGLEVIEVSNIGEALPYFLK